MFQLTCCNCFTTFYRKRLTNKNAFCSKSCAAKYNNKIFPKRAMENKCHDCGCSIPSKYKFCKQCFNNPDKKLENKTIEEVTYNAKQVSNRYAKIRDHARRKYSHITCCQKCGYCKHVEICHIISISQFSKDTKIKDVNAPDNILILCPNCHWEFDNQK